MESFGLELLTTSMSTPFLLRVDLDLGKVGLQSGAVEVQGVLRPVVVVVVGGDADGAGVLGAAERPRRGALSSSWVKPRPRRTRKL